MFQGAIPTASVQQLATLTGGWDTDQLYVGCSGTFKIERGLASRFRQVHGNDVTLYSCAIGWWMAKDDWRLAVRDEARERWGWLDEFCGDPDDNLATILSATTMLQKASSKRADNRYFTALLRAYREQFPALHAKAKQDLPPQLLSSFYPGDVRDFMAMADKDAGFISFPPFFGGGYERMFAGLHDVFDWDAPDYREFDGDHDIPGVLAQAAEFKQWVIGSHMVIDSLHDQLRAVVRTKGWPIYLYSNTGETAVVSVAPVRATPTVARRLQRGDDIGDHMTIEAVKTDEFNGLRFAIMNNRIVPATPHLAFVVKVDGLVVGAFGVQWESVGNPLNMFSSQLPGPTCYLLSDFPVPGTDYPRLSKLILHAAVSSEAQALIERKANHLFRSVKTTAFSQNPVSMKYRGTFDLLTRKPAPKDAHHRHELIYGSELGRWSLDEGLAEWKRRHGKKEGEAA